MKASTTLFAIPALFVGIAIPPLGVTLLILLIVALVARQRRRLSLPYGLWLERERMNAATRYGGLG